MFKHLKQLTGVIVLMGVCTAAGAAKRTTVPLAPGIDYTRLTLDGPVVVHLLSADRQVASVRPAVALAGPRLLGGEALPAIVNEAGGEGWQVAGALNGGHAISQPGDFRGVPIGLLIANHELLCDPWPLPRTAFILLADGTPRLERLAMSGKVSGPDGLPERIHGLNRRRLPGELVLYTQRFNPATRIDEPGMQIAVSGAFADGAGLVAGQSYTGRVEARVDGRVNVEIPKDGVVLAGSGPSANWLASRKIGDPVTFTFELTPNLGDVADAIGAGPRILRDGKVSIEAEQEQLEITLQTGRQPRSAVGFSSTRIVFVAVDGRAPSHSIGLDLPALAQLLLDEGCTEAMELDGGGATTLYARDRVINQPSDGLPRPLANALLLLTSGQLTTDPLPGPLAADGAAPVPVPATTTPTGTTPRQPAGTPPPAVVTDEPPAVVTTTPPTPVITPPQPDQPTTVTPPAATALPETPTAPATPAGGEVTAGGSAGAAVRLRAVPELLTGSPAEPLSLQVIAEDGAGRQVAFDPAELRYEVAPVALGEFDAEGRFRARVPGMGRVKVSLGELSTLVGIKISPAGGDGSLPGVQPPDRPGVIAPEGAAGQTAPAGGATSPTGPRVAPQVPEGVWRQFDGFEQARHWSSKVTPSDLPGGFAIVKKNIRLEGDRCGELRYDFSTTSEPRAVYALYDHGIGSPKFVSVYVFGDGQGQTLKGQFLDNKTGLRHTVTFAENISWDHQWRRCGALIPEGIKGVVIWEAIYLVPATPEAKSAGAIYLDKLEGVY